MNRYFLPFVLLVAFGCRKEQESINSNDLLAHVKTENLSVARTVDETVVFDNKVFFISGWGSTYDIGTPIREYVDIYDLKTRTWSAHQLSQSKNHVSCFTTANKLVILGGYTRGDFAHTIDIYNSTTKTWSSRTTDFGFEGFRGIVVGSNIYLVNIQSFDFDDATFMIYDTENDVWTKGNTPTRASYRSLIADGNKLYIGGGTSFDEAKKTYTYYKTLDIYDIETKTWRTDSLSVARGSVATAKVGNKLFFIGGVNESGPVKTIDIYNTQTNTWEKSEIPQTFDMFSLIDVGNYLFFMDYAFLGKETDAMLVYNKLTSSWSQNHWGTPRTNRQITTSDNHMIVGGGNFEKEKTLNIYSVNTNSWSDFKLNDDNNLSERVYKIVGDSLLFIAGGCVLDTAGGYTTYSSQVDIYKFK